MTKISRALLAGFFAAAVTPAAMADETIRGSDGVSLNAQTLAEFNDAWAMTFLPDGHMLVTEKSGNLWLLGANGAKLGTIDNAPSVDARGQGGLGDIIAHPDFATNGTVFISYVERDSGNDALSGAAVERATLTLTQTGGTLSGRETIWRQYPKVTGNGHYGHRLAISPNGHLFITSGERQKFSPAQNMSMNLGKVIRIHQDGSIPEDNPFYDNGGMAAQVWTLGHRNPLGIDFDAAGQLWVHEMGPRGGDELNKIVRSENYGYPNVSEGKHYSGVDIPDHKDIPIYEAPAVSWVPAISPAGFTLYDGALFTDWMGDGFIGGLSSTALIRVDMDAEDGPVEAARYEWDTRIREVETGPDGALYVLEDDEGRLLRLTPKQ
ncbi:PQQ-dependent sugar dehydrogenase [Robiginitomaculum antarcticum]|uniref:PQQ-dependent sugar dehydrogenase n=1 Tax=Robiginitomaculum antarcticum TaxID=437507 RepID=UPI0003641145|nr:PQQ-dependent sugar dehydrogenase [Robiginitomaculum antarcticum]